MELTSLTCAMAAPRGYARSLANALKDVLVMGTIFQEPAR